MGTYTNTDCLVTMDTFITKVRYVPGVTFATMVIKVTTVHSLLWHVNLLISTPDEQEDFC